MKRNKLIAEINVTPFVDVMLVLLIIFMVTAPFLTQGVEVDLPQTKSAESLPQEQEQLILTVKRDGQIFLDKYVVEMDELERKLPKIVQGRPLFLQADKTVPYGTVVQIMAIVKACGVRQLGIIAEGEDRR